MLFNAYCTPVYGCQLWCSMFQYCYRKLHVAYNLDSCYTNRDGAVRHSFLYLIMSHRLMLISGNWCILCGVP